MVLILLLVVGSLAQQGRIGGGTLTIAGQDYAFDSVADQGFPFRLLWTLDGNILKMAFVATTDQEYASIGVGYSTMNPSMMLWRKRMEVFWNGT